MAIEMELFQEWVMPTEQWPGDFYVFRAPSLGGGTLGITDITRHAVAVEV